MSRKISLKKPSIKKPKIKKPTKSGVKNTVKSIKLWTFVLLVAGLGMFGYASYTWYNETLMDEEEIFWGMIDKSLNTQSVSRSVEQVQGTRSENQSFLLRFSPTPSIRSSSTVTEINQNRDRSTVTTETLGVKDADYVRYTDIVIPPSAGDNIDYSKIVNIWAKRESSGDQSQAQFLNEALFSFIPFGNFNSGDRSELIQMIRDKQVYKLENEKVRYSNGRPVYEARMSIKPRALVEVLKKYNELTQIGDPDLLNPEEYEDFYSVNVDIVIDVLSRHLTTIDYPGDTRVERFEAYGSLAEIEVPENTISVEELQSKLQ